MCWQSDCLCVKHREIISVLCSVCFTEFSHTCMCICTQIHSCAHTYGTNVLIMLLIYRCTVYICIFSIKCMLNNTHVFVSVCARTYLCVRIYQPFFSHCSSCPEQPYSSRQYGRDPAAGDKNKAIAVMDFPKVNTSTLQMRGILSVAMRASRNC